VHDPHGRDGFASDVPPRAVHGLELFARKVPRIMVYRSYSSEVYILASLHLVVVFLVLHKTSHLSPSRITPCHEKHFIFLGYSARSPIKMVLDQYTYIFAIGTFFALLDAYNNGASTFSSRLMNTYITQD